MSHNTAHRRLHNTLQHIHDHHVNSNSHILSKNNTAAPVYGTLGRQTMDGLNASESEIGKLLQDSKLAEEKEHALPFTLEETRKDVPLAHRMKTAELEDA